MTKVDPDKVARMVRAQRGEEPESQEASYARLGAMLARPPARKGFRDRVIDAVGEADRGQPAERQARERQVERQPAERPAERQPAERQPAERQAEPAPEDHRERGRGRGRARIPSGVPFDRAWLDASVPLLRMLMGALLIGYSSLSTVYGVRDDLSPIERLQQVPALVLGDTRIAAALVIGGVAAFVLQGLQLLLAERHLPGYVLALAADAYYTRRQTMPWVVAVLTVAFVSDPALSESLLWGVTVAFGGYWLAELTGGWRSAWGAILIGALVAVGVWAAGNVIPPDDIRRVISRWLVLQSFVWLLAIGIAYWGEVLIIGPRRTR